MGDLYSGNLEVDDSQRIHSGTLSIDLRSFRDENSFIFGPNDLQDPYLVLVLSQGNLELSWRGRKVVLKKKNIELSESKDNYNINFSFPLDLKAFGFTGKQIKKSSDKNTVLITVTASFSPRVNFQKSDDYNNFKVAFFKKSYVNGRVTLTTKSGILALLESPFIKKYFRKNSINVIELTNTVEEYYFSSKKNLFNDQAGLQDFMSKHSYSVLHTSVLFLMLLEEDKKFVRFCESVGFDVKDFKQYVDNEFKSKGSDNKGLKELENPIYGSPYARNIWDMHIHDNKLYYGFGDSGKSSGPVAVHSYNLESAEFTKEFVVEGAQIERFCEIDGELYIPGHDPRESWMLGNIYRKGRANWLKLRTLPETVHCFDLKYFNEVLYASGSDAKGAKVLISEDKGVSWIEIRIENEFRALRFFEFKDELYLGTYSGRIYHLTDKKFELVNIPWLKGQNGNVIYKATNFQDHLLIIRAFNVNNIQALPYRLKIIKSLHESMDIVLGDGQDIPYDLIVGDDETYVLTNAKVSGAYRTRVYRSSDLKNWKVEVEFNRQTFSRSFEYFEGKFYFGLGTGYINQSAQAGKILRYTSE